MSGKKKRKTWKKGRIAGCFFGIFLISVMFLKLGLDGASILETIRLEWGVSRASLLDKELYPPELIDLAEKNEEAYDFVVDYPKNKDKDFVIDLSEEAGEEGIPLLLQWDERWGYVTYGSGMIALTGCGPTCLSMVLVGLTGDASMNPKEVAGFSEKNGYYTENGTSWELMTQGAQLLGLEAEELPLDEDRIKQALEQGQPIICSMGPGDFTTQGHFIVLTGVDADGRLLLNDPNSRKNSEKAWEYERLKGQIKNLWKYSYQGT